LKTESNLREIFGLVKERKKKTAEKVTDIQHGKAAAHGISLFVESHFAAWKIPWRRDRGSPFLNVVKWFFGAYAIAALWVGAGVATLRSSLFTRLRPLP